MWNGNHCLKQRMFQSLEYSSFKFNPIYLRLSEFIDYRKVDKFLFCFLYLFSLYLYSKSIHVSPSKINDMPSYLMPKYLPEIQADNCLKFQFQKVIGVGIWSKLSYPRVYIAQNYVCQPGINIFIKTSSTYLTMQKILAGVSASLNNGSY